MFENAGDAAVWPDDIKRPVTLPTVRALIDFFYKHTVLFKSPFVTIWQIYISFDSLRE